MHSPTAPLLTFLFQHSTRSTPHHPPSDSSNDTDSKTSNPVYPRSCAVYANKNCYWICGEGIERFSVSTMGKNCDQGKGRGGVRSRAGPARISRIAHAFGEAREASVCRMYIMREHWCRVESESMRTVSCGTILFTWYVSRYNLTLRTTT